MARTLDVDLCVIGAGSAGLTVAAGGSQLGAKTVLIEAAEMGGDCLNTGCVPSKALLAAAHAAQGVREARRFGVVAGAPRIDFGAVHDHVHGVIAAIAPNDSQDRFEGLGVTVIRERARFIGPREIAAGETKIRAKRIVVATGSRAGVPPIPGLDRAPYLTNETIFERREAPEHLIVIGGGPMGAELAQAHRRLGSKVTLLEMFTILAKDDPELVDILRARLAGEGIDIREGIKIEKVARQGKGVAVTITEDARRLVIEGSHILVATGRRANVEGLELETAGVEYTEEGITVDRRLRSSNRRVYAIGDVAGGPQFTHVASYHAGIVIRNILFRLPAKVDYKSMPRVTFTDPELAHVGMNEAQARETHGEIRVLRWPFAENDRAQAERDTDGLLKAVTTRNGRVLGASILGRQAGELILPWVMAVGQGMKASKLAGLIAPYPTRSEVTKRAGGSLYTGKLFSERTKKIVRFLLKFA